MTGLIAKALRGAAAAGVPALLEEARAQNQAKRDARLQEYTRQNLTTQQQFQASERLAGQEFTSAQNAENRAFQAEQGQLTRDQQQGQFESEFALRQQQVERQIRAADLALEDAGLDLAQKKEVRKLREVMTDRNTSPEVKQMAAESLGMLLGEGSPKLQAVTLYGEPNSLGEQPRQTVLVDPISGKVRPITLDGQPPPVEWSDLQDKAATTAANGEAKSAAPKGQEGSAPLTTTPTDTAKPEPPAPPPESKSEVTPNADINAVLEGYTLPTSVLQTARESSAQARVFNEQQRKEREEQQAAAAAKEIAEILESRDLRTLSRTDVRRKAKQAIESGNLTNDQVTILNAAYQRMGIEL